MGRFKKEPLDPAKFGMGNIDLSQLKSKKSYSYYDIKSGDQVLIPLTDNKGNEITNFEAVRNYEQTGKFLGRFKNMQEAEAYAKEIDPEYKPHIPFDYKNEIY